MKALTTLFFSVFPILAAFAADRPHIVLVMADDQGWGDMAYNGHPVVKTPHFDEAAGEGLRFDRFYAAAPVCSPTRASVLTGRHPNRMGVFKWGYPLRPQELTLAEALKGAGYTTGHFGKWHLGSVRRGSNPSHPGRHGFDRWVSAPNFYDNDAVMSDEGTAVHRQGESSAIAVEDALAWMKEALKDETPVFAAIWFGSPHVPHRALDEDRALYAQQPEEERDFLGEITGMDRAFGKLKAGLNSLGIRENTVLWYCSDNGALPGVGRTGGFRGRKGSVYEGGLRVPAILEWPAKLGAPRSTDVRCNTVDIYPTLLEIAGVTMTKQPPLDGTSLVDLIEGPVAKRSRPMGFWDASVRGQGVSSVELMEELLEAQKEGKDLPPPEISRDPDKLPQPPHPTDRFPGHAAWIDGNWKLHRMEDGKQGVQWELYDLQADLEEAQNVFERQSEIVSRMQPALQNWLQSVVESLNGADYEAASAMFNVTKSDFGQTAEGETVSLFKLSNPQGWTAEIITHGATLVTMEVPDKNGALANVNLRLDTWEDYAQGHPLLGSIVGRYANRIAGGKLVIDGTEYPLAHVGNNGVHIHGGSEGLQKQLWNGTAKTYPGEAASVTFDHVSPDGHEGYPGKLSVTLRYTLTENALILDYHATTDKATHLNLTNHAYWNLAGAGSGDVLGHELTLASTHFLEVDERKVPTGRLTPVAGGIMDFRAARALEDAGEVPGGGYDHCYVLNPDPSGEPAFAAKVRDPNSGRVMEVLTTEPGVQLYTANYLSDKLSWRGKSYGRHHAICLETQHYPDTPNHDEFPSTLLRPGESYRQRTVYRFSVEP